MAAGLLRALNPWSLGKNSRIAQAVHVHVHVNAHVNVDVVVNVDVNVDVDVGVDVDVNVIGFFSFGCGNADLPGANVVSKINNREIGGILAGTVKV